MSGNPGGIPELDTNHPTEGRPKSRFEMDKWLRSDVPKVHWLRIIASKKYHLPKPISWDMKEIVLRHWLLDHLVGQGLITGDMLGVNATASNDENEHRQFTQRLAALIQLGQAVQPQQAEGVDMSAFQPPPPPVMGGAQPQAPNGQPAYPPQPPMQQPPPPPQMPMGPPGGYAQPPGPPGQMPYPPQQPPQPQPPGPPGGYAQPPGYAAPPGPPQQGYAAPPGPQMGPPMTPPPPQMGPPSAAPQGGGRGGRRGQKADQAPGAVPPAAPVPPMGAPGGFAPLPAPGMTGAPPMMPSPAAVGPAPGMTNVSVPTAQVDLGPVHQKLDQLMTVLAQQQQLIAAQARKIEMLSMAVTIQCRGMYQKQGSADIVGWLQELNQPIPQ